MSARLDGQVFVVLGSSRPWVAAAVVRWRDRGAAVFTLGPAAGGADHVQVDVSDLDAIREAVGRIEARTHHIHRLVIASGGWSGSGANPQGLDRALVALHLGPFLLTRELRSLLDAAAHPRVVLVTSPVQVGGRLELHEWHRPGRTTSMRVHADSALARTLWSRELARRWPGVEVHCLDPGTAGDVPNLPRSGVLGWFTGQASALTGHPDQARDALNMLVTEPELFPATGGYFRLTRLMRPLPAGRDDAAAQRLWRVSDALVDGREPPPDLTWEPVLP